MLTTGVITVSATALPGDALYGVKLATEQARLLLAQRCRGAREAVDQQILDNRVTEATTIRKLHRPVEQMPLAGRLEDIGPTTWVISGLPVQVNARTTIVGTPVLGATDPRQCAGAGRRHAGGALPEVDPQAGKPGAGRCQAASWQLGHADVNCDLDALGRGGDSIRRRLRAAGSGRPRHRAASRLTRSHRGRRVRSALPRRLAGLSRPPRLGCPRPPPAGDAGQLGHTCRALRLSTDECARTPDRERPIRLCRPHARDEKQSMRYAFVSRLMATSG